MKPKDEKHTCVIERASFDGGTRWVKTYIAEHCVASVNQRDDVVIAAFATAAGSVVTSLSGSGAALPSCGRMPGGSWPIHCQHFSSTALLLIAGPLGSLYSAAWDGWKLQTLRSYQGCEYWRLRLLPPQSPTHATPYFSNAAGDLVVLAKFYGSTQQSIRMTHWGEHSFSRRIPPCDLFGAIQCKINYGAPRKLVSARGGALSCVAGPGPLCPSPVFKSRLKTGQLILCNGCWKLIPWPPTAPSDVRAPLGGWLRRGGGFSSPNQRRRITTLFLALYRAGIPPELSEMVLNRIGVWW